MAGGMGGGDKGRRPDVASRTQRLATPGALDLLARGRLRLPRRGAPRGDELSAVRDRWSRAGRATVYLQAGATDAEVADLARALESTSGVKRVRLVTSTEARREVVADESDAALAALPASAFPASLEVGFADEVEDAELTNMATKLRALPAVDTVETYQRWTERLSALLGGGVTASACLAVIVLCAVVSVIGSTMRLLLQRRKIEVEVLKLVGATNAFVRRPFVLEGATQGAAGALGAIVLLGFLFLIVRGRFDHELAEPPRRLAVVPAVADRPRDGDARRRARRGDGHAQPAEAGEHVTRHRALLLPVMAALVTTGALGDAQVPPSAPATPSAADGSPNESRSACSAATTPRKARSGPSSRAWDRSST